MQEFFEPEGDLDERIDVANALETLPHGENIFISMLSVGYTAAEALRGAGPDVDQNPTRLRKAILTKLANTLNGTDGKRKRNGI